MRCDQTYAVARNWTILSAIVATLYVYTVLPMKSLWIYLFIHYKTIANYILIKYEMNKFDHALGVVS